MAPLLNGRNGSLAWKTKTIKEMNEIELNTSLIPLIEKKKKKNSFILIYVIISILIKKKKLLGRLFQYFLVQSIRF